MRHGLLASIALSLSLAGCGDNQDPAGADALWARIHDLDYRGFAHAPGYATRQPTSAPHGDEVLIFVDPTVEEALGSKTKLASWPEGSLIVKDGYTDGEVTVVAAMEKRKDGWFWAEWHDDGDAKYSGSPDICVDCHKSGSDFVRAFPLPK